MPVNISKITKPRTKLEDDALAVLREFVADVEAVGRKQVGREWPDLSITFNKAERLLITVGTGGYQHV